MGAGRRGGWVAKGPTTRVVAVDTSRRALPPNSRFFLFVLFLLTLQFSFSLAVPIPISKMQVQFFLSESFRESFLGPSDLDQDTSQNDTGLQEQCPLPGGVPPSQTAHLSGGPCSTLTSGWSHPNRVALNSNPSPEGITPLFLLWLQCQGRADTFLSSQLADFLPF